MRNLCCKCPHYYNEQLYYGEYDCGCRVFGEEFEHCPSFWDNDGEADESEMGCNVHPKRIEFLLMRKNKRFDAYIERDSKDNKLVKHYSVLPKEELGYKAYRKDGTWMGFWTDDYRPNLKGGHRHNHIYNVCNRILFRSKNARQIDPTQKQEWRKTFEIQVFGELKRIAKINFLDILKKGKLARITKKRRRNGD
jgi:hypothetical protein